MNTKTISACAISLACTFLIAAAGLYTRKEPESEVIARTVSQKPVLKSDAKEILDASCTSQNLTQMLSDTLCLQQTSRKIRDFSEKFYAQLYSKAGINPDISQPQDLANAWKARINPKTEQEERDIRTIRNYQLPCDSVLSNNIHDPSAPLAFSHTTGYGAARYCLKSAMRIAHDLGIGLDFKAAEDMLNALDDLYDHYDRHPIGEGKPAHDPDRNPF